MSNPLKTLFFFFQLVTSTIYSSILILDLATILVHTIDVQEHSIQRSCYSNREENLSPWDLEPSTNFYQPPESNPVKPYPYLCIVITYIKSIDQPGKVANPARSQLNRENQYISVRVRA